MVRKRNKIIEQIALDMSCTPALMPEASDVVSDESILFQMEQISDLEQTDRDGRTLLFNAAFYGRIEIAAYLIGRECNVNARDNNGLTPLHAAVQSGDTEMVKLLLLRGAEVNQADVFGNPPLLRLSPATPVKLVTALLNHGADPSQKNNFGMCALDVYATYPEIMELLLSYSH